MLYFNYQWGLVSLFFKSVSPLGVFLIGGIFMEIQELKNRIKAYINRIDYKTKKLQEIEALLDEEESYVKYCNTYKKGNSIASQPFILKKEILNEFNEIIKKLNSVELFNLLSIYCKKEQDQLKMFDNYKESYSPKVTFPKAFEDKKQCDREEKKFSCICITGFIGFLADIIYMLSMFFIPTSSLFVMFVVPVLIASLSAGAIVVGLLVKKLAKKIVIAF